MTVKVAFIGVGGVAKGHREYVAGNPRARIVAICDINKEQADKVALEHGVNGYTDYRDMLERESVDAAFLCIPPFAHGTIEEDLAARNIHIFTEKPVGLDPDVALTKLAAIQRAGVINSVGYCLRYLDITEKAAKYLEGKPAAMARGSYFCDFVQVPWWREMAKSGGQLVEQATHTIDLLRVLAGDIDTVYASTALRVMGDAERIDIPDVYSVNLKFASGAVGSYDSTFTQPDMTTSAEVFGRHFRVGIYKTRLVIRDAGGEREFKAEVNPYKVQDDAFIDAVLSGDPGGIRATYAEGIKSLKVSVAANASAASGRPVTCL